MSGREILVDTNILLSMLNGNSTIERILQGKKIYLSVVSELEMKGFKGISIKEEKQIENLLRECVILQIDNPIKSKCVELRKKYQLKLPDTIIAATAIISAMPLISADKQFQTINELDLIMYEG